MARLLSVNVGLPREVTWNGKAVRTAVWKFPVNGQRMVRKLNIDGDAQGDLAGHGGEHRAVFVYQIDSYHYWEHFLGRNDFSFGQFGENFTVEDLPDDEVCIGDRYRIGGAIFEVTQPRVTCYRVGIRMNEPRMPALLVSQHRPGFYFRVLQEGEVGANDEIVKIAGGPERITVRDIDALLYLPGHSREQLERALQVRALSKGWQSSFQAMLEREPAEKPVQGNPGLADEQPAPAWAGFKQMKVAHIRKESNSVTSFMLIPLEGELPTVPQPGQFIVLRLQADPDKAPVLRGYSLSDLPAADHFRISVKSESNGIGSSFLCNQVREGDVLEVSAPRGSFTLRPGEHPIVLLSAGVAVTPVLSMLHALAAEKSQRPVWWLYGARNRDDHPFAEEARSLLRELSGERSYIVYSKPALTDQVGKDFDAPGHLDVALLVKLNVPRDGEYYLCGPSSFLQNMGEGLRTLGVAAENVHSEIFGTLEAITPGVAQVQHKPHMPEGPAGPGPSVSFARSGLTVAWNPKFASLLELAEACDVPVRWSCRTGVCHTCMTGLISGSILYAPEPLERPAEGNVLVCCSQPNSAVILDLCYKDLDQKSVCRESCQIGAQATLPINFRILAHRWMSCANFSFFLEFRRRGLSEKESPACDSTTAAVTSRWLPTSA
jgi:ferredoxin-NADP reductase/MOSC domain-containing protein YiiM